MLTAGVCARMYAALCLLRSWRGTCHAALEEYSYDLTRCFPACPSSAECAWLARHKTSLDGGCNGAQAQAHYKPGCNAGGSDADKHSAQSWPLHRPAESAEVGCGTGNSPAAEQHAGIDAFALAPAALAQLIEKIEMAHAQVSL